jgi:hypothetical protein
MRRGAVILVLGLVAAGCGGGPPEVGAPVNPHGAGEAVEVGGWHQVETTLVGTTAEVEKTGDRQSNGWSVTVVAPSGDCPVDPMVPEKGVLCIGLEIRNNTAQAGGLEIWGNLPLLVDAAGGAASPIGMSIAGMEWMDFSQAVSSSADCTFSAPDAQGRQQADCAAMVVITRHSGVGGEETSGWVTVGTGKKAGYDLKYSATPGQSGMALYWPDGTWLALP